MDEEEVHVSASPVSEGEQDDQAVALDDIKASIDALKESVDGIKQSMAVHPVQSEDIASVLNTLDHILEVIEAGEGEPLEITLDGSEGGQSSTLEASEEVYEYTEYEVHTLEALQYQGALLTIIIAMIVSFAIYRFFRIFF